MRGLAILLFLSWGHPLFAQMGERWFITLGPSVTVGNHFEGGQNSISAPTITGSHHIHPLYSPLWGFPNPQYSGFENLGRKLHMGFQYERFFNRYFGLVTGLELGSRGYVIKSDFSNDLLVSYRAITAPLYAAFSPFKGNFWTFRQNIGLQFAYYSSIPERIPGNLEMISYRTVQPQLYAGLELIHKSFSAPFSFEISYCHGFSNAIKHNYLALDYETPIPVYSSGSAFRFTIKYLVREKYIYSSKPKKQPPVVLTEYDELAYRTIKDPIKVKAASDSIRLCLQDDQTIDGDSVAIEFNQRLLHRDIMIQREAFCFDIVLVEGASNTLVVHALNEGKIPPNTCVMDIYIKDEKMEVRLKSDMKNSGAIIFER